MTSYRVITSVSRGTDAGLILISVRTLTVLSCVSFLACARVAVNADSVVVIDRVARASVLTRTTVARILLSCKNTNKPFDEKISNNFR